MTTYVGVRFPSDGFEDETETCGYRVKLVNNIGVETDICGEEGCVPKCKRKSVHRVWYMAEHTDLPVFTCGKRRGITFDEVMEKDRKFTARVLNAEYIYIECIASFRKTFEWVFDNDKHYAMWLINTVHEVKALKVLTGQAHGFMCKYWNAFEYFVYRDKAKIPHRFTREGMPKHPEDYDESQEGVPENKPKRRPHRDHKYRELLEAMKRSGCKTPREYHNWLDQRM
eukprot:jgi/Tetstr1/459027/TSEL_004495.t1